MNTSLACQIKQTTCFFITPRTLGIGTDKLFHDISHSLMFCSSDETAMLNKKKTGEKQTENRKK